ncbi:MAG: SUMF1/EgtB/PvdO family nonheme iron enzyme [Proteobacteria bacterium]|nr:SUMF1/EgtB/PvdO family nonheme iron enzyme [Pseudomonadota bacterium]
MMRAFNLKSFSACILIVVTTFFLYACSGGGDDPAPVVAVPSAPTGLQITWVDDQITVSWDAVTGATSYNLYQATTTGVTKDNYASKAGGTKVSGVTSPIARTGLVAGTTYYFVVTAVNSGGESLSSSEVLTTPLAVPSNVQISWADGQVTVSWNAVSGATSYNLYQATEAGVTRDNFASKASGTMVSGVTSPTTRTGLTNGTPYYFVVTAVNSGGESLSSSQVSAAPLSAPTGFTRAAGNFQVALLWTAVTGATSYNVYYDTTAGVSKSTLNSVNVVTSPYILSSLTNGTPYYLVVTAVNSAGESDESTEIVAIPNPYGFEFVLVPAGVYTMGSPVGELGHDSFDEYEHQVTLTTPFFITATEVTQKQWQDIAMTAPSLDNAGDGFPVENITWDEAAGLLTTLNIQGWGIFRLPTEAEWEYAARAGSTTAFANGEITVTGSGAPDPVLVQIGWYGYNSGNVKKTVASAGVSNAWGIYDMHGNLAELTNDWFVSNLGTDPVLNPTGPGSGSFKAIRGGNFGDESQECRSAHRGGIVAPSTTKNGATGFRIVRDL